MALTLKTGPLVEPVSLTDVRTYLRIDASTTDEDTLLTSLITAARLTLETETACAFIAQTWEQRLDAWPDTPIVLHKSPLISLDTLEIIDEADVRTLVPSSLYSLDATSTPARVALRNGQTWPATKRALAGIAAGFTAGYGAAATDVPAPLRQAILYLVSHWFERRDPVAQGPGGAELPATVSALIAPFRSIGL